MLKKKRKKKWQIKMKKWKWEKWDLFILLIRIDGEGNSRLGSRRTSRRGVRRNLQRERCRMILRWICCWAKGIILLGQQGVQNLPGLVDEEEEPLEVANCGVAEIWDVLRSFRGEATEWLKHCKVELGAFVKVTVFGKDNLLQNFVNPVSSSQLSKSYCPQHHLLDLQHNQQLKQPGSHQSNSQSISEPLTRPDNDRPQVR